MPIEAWRAKPGVKEFRVRLHPCGHSVRVADVIAGRISSDANPLELGYACPECGQTFGGAGPVFLSRDCTPSESLAWPDAERVMTQEAPSYPEQVSQFKDAEEIFLRNCVHPWLHEVHRTKAIHFRLLL